MVKRYMVVVISTVILMLLSSFSCTTPKPAEFIVFNVDVNPSEVAHAVSFTVTATIGNIGGVADNYTAILNIDGKERARKTVYVNPSENMTLYFETNESNIGTHQVEIGAIKKDFSVTNRTFLLQYDKGHPDSYWFKDDPMGQWIRFIPPVIPFQISKIFVMGRRTDFNQPDTKYYTIKIWDGDFKKELISNDYPYSKFNTDVDMVSHEVNPPITVTGSFIVEFISHGESIWSPGQAPKGKTIMIYADYTSDSPGNIGISSLRTNNIPAFEYMFQYGAGLQQGTWIIRAEGTGKKAETVATAEIQPVSPSLQGIPFTIKSYRGYYLQNQIAVWHPYYRVQQMGNIPGGTRPDERCPITIIPGAAIPIDSIQPVNVNDEKELLRKPGWGLGTTFSPPKTPFSVTNIKMAAVSFYTQGYFGDYYKKYVLINILDENANIIWSKYYPWSDFRNIDPVNKFPNAAWRDLAVDNVTVYGDFTVDILAFSDSYNTSGTQCSYFAVAWGSGPNSFISNNGKRSATCNFDGNLFISIDGIY